MTNDAIARRTFLAGVGTAGGLAVSLETSSSQAAPAASAEPTPWLVLTAEEAAFYAATSDTIIPADALSPSGTDCGIPIFIDRQLAGAWGAGARMYRAGPFHQGTPEQGYQLPLTPREFFAAGVQAANAWSRKTYGKTFDRLPADQRMAALTAMEKGEAEFDDFDAHAFFQTLLTITIEGFFSDPVYGGNRDKVSWRMLGFPGLPATYAGKIDEYRDKRYVAEPRSIADFS
jgi:gluconate 2-dehydrogenase gamma chain